MGTIEDSLAKAKQALKPAPKNEAIPMPGVPSPRYYSKYAEALEKVKAAGETEIAQGMEEKDRMAYLITKSKGHGRGPVVWMRKRWPLYKFWERKTNDPAGPKTEDRDIYVMYMGVEQKPNTPVRKKRKKKVGRK